MNLTMRKGVVLYSDNSSKPNFFSRKLGVVLYNQSPYSPVYRYLEKPGEGKPWKVRCDSGLVSA